MDLKENIKVLKEIRISEYQEQNLKSTDNNKHEKNSELGIEDPILEVKAKTDKGTNRIELFDIKDPISKNNHLISKMLINKPRPSTVGNNNRDAKEIDKEKEVQPMSYSKAIKDTTKNKHTFISSDWKCEVIKKRIWDKRTKFDNKTWYYDKLLEALKDRKLYT
ncbi:9865_t:CDS:2, partial [Gigaspora margarita]